MNTNAFRLALYSYFGVSRALVALHLTQPTAVISLNKRVYRPGERMSLLIIPDVETSQIAATLNITRLSGPTVNWPPTDPVNGLPMKARRQNSSRCRSLRLRMPVDIAWI